MAGNFSTTVNFEGKAHLAIIVPSHRRNGMHYEVNITGFPRFWMHWGAMDRFEVVRPAEIKLPDALVLAVSDAIEREVRDR
jgi:hypothetical protein